MAGSSSLILINEHTSVPFSLKRPLVDISTVRYIYIYTSDSEQYFIVTLISLYNSLQIRQPQRKVIGLHSLVSTTVYGTTLAKTRLYSLTKVREKADRPKSQTRTLSIVAATPTSGQPART
jgi:hypothetical protein